MDTPRQMTWEVENAPWLPVGDWERFTGYGITGIPFASGHILCLRRFPATSIGPGYTSVWHRNPDGDWVFYADAEPRLTCSRYFGATLADSRRSPIELRWLGPWSLAIEVPGADLFWHVRLATSPAVNLLNGVARLLPESGWRSPRVLRAMGAVAGPLLGAGELALSGTVPNGQRFVEMPRRMWRVSGSIARARGVDFGVSAPLPTQERLGDFTISQRGIFAIGHATFEPFDPARHLNAIRRPDARVGIVLPFDTGRIAA